MSTASPNAPITRDGLAVSLLVEPQKLQTGLNRLIARGIVGEVKDESGHAAFLVDDHAKLDALLQPSREPQEARQGRRWVWPQLSPATADVPITEG